MKNIEEAKRSLIEKPLLATSAERFLILNELKSSYKDLPHPLRFSRILSILLQRVSTPLEDFDIIAGRCVDRLLTDDEEVAFAEFCRHPDYPSRSLFFSSGHCTYSWDMLLSEGIGGLRTIVKSKLDSTEDSTRRDFLCALVEIYDAISAYILRYARAAHERGMKELASRLESISSDAPKDFGSALQLLFIVTLINCAYISGNSTLTVGRLDLLLYPYYLADTERGVLTRDEAKQYITDYYCKHNLIMGRGEHQVGDATNSTTFKRIVSFDSPQYLLLGGIDDSGKSAVNTLTYLFSECIVPEFKNPVVVVRYTEGLDNEEPLLWKILCERALESSSLMFYNDKNVRSAFARIGIPAEEVNNYAHFGCNWCSPGDDSAWMMSSPKSKDFAVTRTLEEKRALDVPYMRTRSEHSWPEDFVEVMRELVKREGEVTIDDFYSLFFSRMAEFIDRKLRHLSLELEVRKRNPASAITFGDAFFRGSIERAECFASGAKYHFELQAFQMFGTVADCFIAVDQLVMIERKLTLARLLEAVDAGFEGYSDVLALCRKADKYGMDTELSAKHARRLSHTASDLVIEKNRPYFEKQRLFLVPCMQSDTWHLKYGSGYGATPDGRLPNTPYSQNSRPSNGAAKNGITAMLNDMLNLPSDGLVSGALNLDVNPKDFEGEEGRALFASLLATYLNRGGLHAQVSAVGIDALIDAQNNPHLHGDLRVRITGYSGIFVDVCETLQEDIIDRFR